MQNGVTIDDSTSSKDKFEIGDAIIGQLTVKLNNFNGKFTPHSFDGAVLKPSIGMVIKRDYTGDTLEWIPKGIFTVDAPDSAGSVLTITALDNMNKFDTDYSVSTLTYPTTLLQIVQDVCSISGVELATTAFTNSDYTVQDKPEEAATCNCREMLQYVASLAGCFARINRDGKLELKFYDFDSLKIPDGENGSPYLIDATTSLNYGKSDTTITGLQIIPGYSDIEQYKVGSDGYVVKINKNPLAQHDLQTLADNIWNDHLKSATFRELDSNIWSNPALEAGDTARIKDRQGNEYNIIISNLTFSLGSPEKISSDAESLSAKNAIRFSPLDKVTKSLTDLNGYYDTLKISVSKVEDGLELKVSKEDYNSEINILTNQINSKVSEGDIGSLIEQNPTSVVFA
ncbi:MAG: hypothetical protein PHE09_20165, partial [Oscillospiraceae bacterium]|nr:hypothetical protein [Oscillospiraceae bacterium]